MSVAALLGDTRQSALTRALPMLCATLAGLWLAWTLVQLLWSFFPQPEPAPQNVSVTPATGTAVRANAPVTSNVASLASYHLFGQTPPGELPNAPDAPETQLKLTLQNPSP